MATYSKSQSNLKPFIDLTLIGFGIMIGGAVSLMALWLWFDYQARPEQSYLVALSGLLARTIPAPVHDLYAEQAQLMGLPLTGETSAYWYLARAGGVISYLLLWFSTVWGLLLSTKLPRVIPPPISFGLHEFLAILSIVFIALHSFVLLGDSYIAFNLFHLMIPFTAPYEPFWTGLGTLAFYLSVAMTLSFYVRKQIGRKVWRSLHYLTFVAYIFALLHGVMAGTDSSRPAMVMIYLGTGLSVLFLVNIRLLTASFGQRRSRRARP